MPQNVVNFTCVIISPSDVDDERDAVERAVLDWNVYVGRKRGVQIQTVRWEHHVIPELGDEPQAIINRQLLDVADFGIAVFWVRLGSPTSVHESGSVEEIELLVARKQPVLLYFCDRDVPQTKLRDAQFQRLQQIKDRYSSPRYSSGGVIKSFSTAHELRAMVQSHLSRVIDQLLPEPTKATNEATKPDEKQSPAAGAKPDVRVLAVRRNGKEYAFLGRDFYEIRIENHSEVPVYLESLRVLTDRFETIQLVSDAFTGAPFMPGKLEPADRRSFFIDATELKRAVPHSKIQQISVVDMIGREFESAPLPIEYAYLNTLHTRLRY